MSRLSQDYPDMAVIDIFIRYEVRIKSSEYDASNTQTALVGTLLAATSQRTALPRGMITDDRSPQSL